MKRNILYYLAEKTGMNGDRVENMNLNEVTQCIRALNNVREV